ncbi:DNA polymerase IV 1 [Christensenellaceae bacterium]|nr:DNA polymerase IV 1 [Christensenellaceae bacterium]BDF60350.1 DNA polymerase IV 1 [Christensenellaceae bacterium]
MQNKKRIILHIDCNAFYASVEEVLHPELKKVPMAICGNPESRRGIILAKNELAKKKGVATAETIWQAKRKCPNLVLAPARHSLYREYCETINAIYEQYTDRVERFSIDESFLDVTGSLHLFGSDARALADQIRLRIEREVGITVSVGVSFNKILAKIGSDLKKPNATTVLSEENFREILWPMPVSTLLMVGKSTEKRLENLNIRTVGDLANADIKLLERCLGKNGVQLSLYANGRDDAPVLRTGEGAQAQSIGNGMTFKRNLVCEDDIRTAVTALADTVAARLRKSNRKCSSLQVTIKDANLKVITRQRPTPYPLWLAADIAREAFDIIAASWKIGTPIRMLAITGQKLVLKEAAQEQLSFLTPEKHLEARGKRESLEKAVDSIRERFGRNSISPGRVIKNDLGIQEEYNGDTL